MAEADLPTPRWVKLLDQSRCIGCHACTTACKSENEVPVGVTRTYVKSVDVGVFPQARRVFQVTRCNQCEVAPAATLSWLGRESARWARRHATRPSADTVSLWWADRAAHTARALREMAA